QLHRPPTNHRGKPQKNQGGSYGTRRNPDPSKTNGNGAQSKEGGETGPKKLRRKADFDPDKEINVLMGLVSLDKNINALSIRVFSNVHFKFKNNKFDVAFKNDETVCS